MYAKIGVGGGENCVIFAKISFILAKYYFHKTNLKMHFLPTSAAKA
jgi:hypothetical protein